MSEILSAQTRMLFAFNALGKSVYEGTARAKGIANRKKNKVARRSRRINRLRG